MTQRTSHFLKNRGLATPRIGHVCLSLTVGIYILAAFPLQAAETPLFQINKNDWVSLDHYDPAGDIQKPASTVSTPLPATAAPLSLSMPILSVPSLPVNASVPVSPLPVAAPATSTSTKTSKTPVKGAVVASPSRPLNLPPMPEMSHSYNVHIDSTEDAEVNNPPHIANMATEPSIELPPSNWLPAADAAHIHDANKKLEALGSSEAIPVRLSFLPSHKMIPAPDPNGTIPRDRTALLKQQMAIDNATPAPAAKAQQTPQQLAACAAVDAYKKHQLEAIQSDRQTLAALQAAIAQLGLQNQLNFLTDPNSSVGKTADGKAADGISTPSLVLPANTASARADTPTQRTTN